MRNVVLTGLRNEVDLKTGQTTVFGLVFNDGGLYIDVDQETMKRVVEYAFGSPNGSNGEVEAPTPESPAIDRNEMQEVSMDEDEIPQL